MSVLLGLGDGTFATQQVFDVGDSPVSVTTGDFNGDGFTDLATANSADVSVLINQPGTVLLGDINCDGEVNLLDVAPFVDALISGMFEPKADINQDGTVDLLDVGPFVDLLTNG